MEKETFIDKRQRTIDLVFDEDQLVCHASFEAQKIGSIEFSPHESGNGVEYWLMKWCYLDELPGFTHCGIGEAIIRFVGTYSIPIVARGHDGQQRQDGSHLTGNAPGFVQNMISKGLMYSLEPDEEHCN